MLSPVNKIFLFPVIFPLIFSIIGCQQTPKQETVSFPKLPAPELKRMSAEQFGIDVNAMKVVQSSFEENQFLTDVLQAHNVAPEVIDEVARKSESVFDVRLMRAGNYFTIIKNQEQKVDYFIYEKTPSNYVVFDLRDSVLIYEGKRQTQVMEKTISGTIESSLYETLEANHIDPAIGKLLERTYTWSVDFFHLEKGDFFKMIYEEEFVDGESVGISKMVASQFHHDGDDFYAFYFRQSEEDFYFDDEGRSLRREFLKTPLRYSYLSERYSRQQPEGEGNESDKEIDYKAPTGTPVYAVGDGKIVKIRNRKGKYVRIKHGIYTTQYANLSQISENLTTDSEVKQGQMIGYVGDMGNDSQKGVSFRVWKNGKVVSPRSLSLPAVEVITPENQADFEKIKKQLIRKLDETELKTPRPVLVMQG